MTLVKEIYIDDVFLGDATKATIKKEIDSESTATFQRTIVDNNPNPSVTVSVESIVAGTINQYIALLQKIKYAESLPVTIQLVVQTNGDDGVITEKDFAYKCKLSSDEYEVDPVKRTAKKLEFIGETSRKLVNGVEI